MIGRCCFKYGTLLLTTVVSSKDLVLNVIRSNVTESYTLGSLMIHPQMIIYKIILIGNSIRSNIEIAVYKQFTYIYNLRENRWRKLNPGLLPFDFCCRDFRTVKPVLVGQTLHWLLRNPRTHPVWKLLAFDSVKESFSLVLLPPMDTDPDDIATTNSFGKNKLGFVYM